MAMPSPMTDDDSAYWCQWCGENIPDERLHLATCSSRCAADLNADKRRRDRMCTSCEKRPKDTKSSPWCAVCRQDHRREKGIEAS